MNDDTIDEARLRKLQDEVAKLPASIDPPANAWMRIRAAIESEKNASSTSASYARARAAFWQHPAFLAAAALLLVAGSSALTAIALRRGGTGEVRQIAAAPEARGVQAPSRNDTGPVSLAQFTVVESDYLRAVNDLSATLESERGSLSPETIAKLQESIKVIDAAIFEARNALAADPANRTLIQILANSYEQKVDLLKRTTEMARG
jgi:hypothetical protein